MKLTYRDKIILAIGLSLAIILAGYFVFIKKKNAEIKENQAKLETLQTQREEIERKINATPGIQKGIKETYANTQKLTEIFMPKEEIKNTLLLDEKMQKYADENDVKIVSLELSESKVDKIKYYFLETKDKESDLREAADINGDLQASYDEETKESASLSQRNVESLIKTQYGLKINGTKDNIWKYLEAIEGIDKAVKIDSVNILDYTFGADAAAKAGQQLAQAVSPTSKAEGEGEEGEEDEVAASESEISSVTTADGKVIDNTSDVQVVITLYSVIEMPEPDVETIPAA